MGLLSQTSKMPGPSIGLPAGTTCQLCKVPCYAKKGRYLFHTEGMMERYRHILDLMSKGSGILAMVLTEEIRQATRKKKYFRIHDSGDFFSPEYVKEWILIAKNLPDVRFWAPTKAWQVPEILAELLELAKLPNVTIRPSSVGMDEEPPTIKGLDAGSGVKDKSNPNGFVCPSSQQDGKCAECRHCWDERKIPVWYPKH